MTVLASDTEGAIAATEATYSASYPNGLATALTAIGTAITAIDVPGTADVARFAALHFADLVNRFNLAYGQSA